MLASVLTGLTILIVGDSHLTVPYYLIDSLHTGLEKQGAQVHTLGICGTDPGDWLSSVKGDCGAAERRGTAPAQVLKMDTPTTPIDALIANDKPDLVIVVMGDTIGAYKQASFPKTWAWQQVTSLTKAIAKTDTACLWVGPAWGTEGGKYQKTFARVKLVSSFLASNVAPCGYIDSLKLSKPGEWATTDGQHFTQAGYQAWGGALVEQVLAAPVVAQLKKK